MKLQSYISNKPKQYKNSKISQNCRIVGISVSRYHGSVLVTESNVLSMARTTIAILRPAFQPVGRYHDSLTVGSEPPRERWIRHDSN